jgi:hypothetical protein
MRNTESGGILCGTSAFICPILYAGKIREMRRVQNRNACPPNHYWVNQVNNRVRPIRSGFHSPIYGNSFGLPQLVSTPSCQSRLNSVLDSIPVWTRLRFQLGFGCDLVPVSTRLRFRRISRQNTHRRLSIIQFTWRAGCAEKSNLSPAEWNQKIFSR